MTKDEALKMALETLEIWKGYMPHLWDKTDEQAITAIKEALAQPEQEPVARWHFNSGFSHCQVHKLNEASKKNSAPLYLAPAQRTWVGLTDEEIMDMYNEPRSDAEMIAFGREVEAKLKDKNEN